MGHLSKPGVMAIAEAKGLTSEEQELVRDLANVLLANNARNAERTSYYDGEEGLRNIGIAIPPELTDLRLSCSWPAKAVDALADRSIYDGVSFRSGSDIAGIERVLVANHMASKYDKAKRTELIHGPAFWTVSRGLSPHLPVIIRQHSAESASAIWDDEAGHIRAGLVIAAWDRRPGHAMRPVRVNVYTAEAVLAFKLARNHRWTMERMPHPMGRPMMEAMVFSPTTEKPLGTSRITRAVMSITDCAIRESLRSEIHAELFTAPQKYLLGASQKQIKGLTRYESFFGNIFALEKNNNGENPVFGQLAQASMEPHISYMRQLAAQLSGATDVPISTLGVIHDNPSSAEAIHAAEQPLVIRAEAMNLGNAEALENVIRMAIAVKLEKSMDELTEDEAGVVVSFRRPDRPSQASQSDAALKIASTTGMEWFGGTDVCLEMQGFTESERLRLQSDKRRAEAMRAVANVLKAPREEAVRESAVIAPAGAE